MLAHLSVLVDKYQMLESVEPYVDLWVADEDMKESLPSTSAPELLPWLSIAWVFNLSVEFKHLTQILMQESFETIFTPVFDGHELPIPEIVISMYE